MSEIQNHTYEELQIGQAAHFSKILTADDVDMFAAVSGDLNPVHLDESYAATTAFKGRIGHGAWIGSVVSAAIAMTLPGPGSIYRSQQLSFKEPVRIGDEVTVSLEVAEKKDRVRLVVINCVVVNQLDKTVAKGVAEVIAPTEKLSLPVPELPRFHRDG